MAYGFVLDVPATEEMYRSVRAQLGDETPKGLVLHLAVKGEGGLRYIDVWDTQADWEAYNADVIGPAIGKMLAEFGVEAPAERARPEELQLVDVWVG